MLHSKVVLVTGGGSGIGAAACMAFAREGAKVAVFDTTHEAAERTAAAIRQGGGHAVPLVGDVADEDNVKGMVLETCRVFGRLDCAFNNAGIGGRAVGVAGMFLADVAKPAWDRIIAVNLTGVWLCMKHQVAAMRDEGGSIVNTASIAGLKAVPGSPAYVAAKHGVVGLTKAAALEYSSAGIRVNAICPGYIETPLTQSGSAEAATAYARRAPMKRTGQPGDVAEMAVWLCSDHASYVTGTAMVVDGGYLAS